MQSGIITNWLRWKARRKANRCRRLLNKHLAIESKGMNLYALLVQTYAGAQFNNGYDLYYIKLRIQIPDGSYAEFITATLCRTGDKLNQGRVICFRFLPGDLSQISIVS